VSVGSWMQTSNSSIAEIMGDAGYDWIAIDLEHGSINIEKLIDLNRALLINCTLPLVRIAQNSEKDCKDALETGAAGLIIPKINSQSDIIKAIEYSCWPPKGKRGVGFSRANLFGKYFKDYEKFAQKIMIIAMIESIESINNLDEILGTNGLDGILIGPYDLSASMGITGKFNDDKFKETINLILKKAKNSNIACGIHQVDPNPNSLKSLVDQGFTFIPYAIDTVFLEKFSKNPLSK
jgi:2-dehydro-3-deoxyglucarate aldolase